MNNYLIKNMCNNCLLIIFCLFGLMAKTQDTATLFVEIQSLRINTGTVYVSLHDGPEGFPGGEGNKVDGVIAIIKDDKAFAVFNGVAFGEYGVSVFHDENDNGEMDTNWIGIPKEGVGASNNAKGKMGPPKYEDAKFQFKSDGQKIKLDMDYY